MNKNSEQRQHEEYEILQAKVTDKTSIYIKSIDKTVSLSQPVYAINWFNARCLWLYNFYNLLAGFSVKKVGGRPFFKGLVKQVLYGQEQQRREVLLIVNYPAVENFKQMAESRYFQLVSLLRMVAVKEFTFGFSQRTDANGPELKHETRGKLTDKAYLIHHYQGGEDILPEIENVIRQHEVEVIFSGRISSLLYSGDKSMAKEQVPCLMDGTVLLQADDLLQLMQAVYSDDYERLIKQTESSFIATLERVF